MIYLIIALTVVLTIMYFVVMFVWPEWVGISGKDSDKTLEAHKEEES